MSKESLRKATKMPDTDDVKTLAEFFDEHSTSDLDGEFVDVDYSPKTEVLSVRFEPGDMIQLSRKARELGMDKSTLVRFVVKQFIASSTNEEAAASEKQPASVR